MWYKERMFGTSIQPETKVEYEARIARGDYSPWGYPKEQFEEDEKIKDEDH